MNRSNTSFTTACVRASDRSILLMTTIGVRRRSSALRSTNRVCGSGPSDASTSSMMPSTIDSVRSTSPPKSAWPGVSTMLMRNVVVVHGRVLGQNRDAALALEHVRVHDPFGHPLVGPEDPALVQHRIHQRRLAVVDVGDDGDVAPGGVGDLLRVQTGAKHLTSIAGLGYDADLACHGGLKPACVPTNVGGGLLAAAR